MTADFFVGLFLGATLGLWSGHIAWKAKLRDKIYSGLRLELDGKLYDIRSAENG
jgi:hypothetical protein